MISDSKNATMVFTDLFLHFHCGLSEQRWRGGGGLVCGVRSSSVCRLSNCVHRYCLHSAKLREALVCLKMCSYVVHLMKFGFDNYR